MNKGFDAKGQVIKCIPFIDAVNYSTEIKHPSRLKRKKNYNGTVLKKQKSFSKLPF